MHRSVARRWLGVLRTPLGLTATVLMVGVLALAVFAPILWTDQADAIDTGNILAGPSAEHWAGTDNLGRDIFYRVLVATRLSVELALAATLIAVSVGLLLGTAPFLVGRRAGRAVTAAVNVAVAFPGLLLALFFAVIFGVGATGAVLAIGMAGAPAMGRLTQTLVASVAARDFVAAARVAGVGRVRMPLPSRAPQRRRAARRPGHHRRGWRAAVLRRALVPRPRGAATQLRLGSSALRRDRRDLHQPRRRVRAGVRRPHRRPRVQPLRGDRRQGSRDRHDRWRPASDPRVGRGPAARAHRRRDAGSVVRRGARRPRPRGQLPRPPGADPPGARGELRRTTGRGARRRG